MTISLEIATKLVAAHERLAKIDAMLADAGRCTSVTAQIAYRQEPNPPGHYGNLHVLSQIRPDAEPLAAEFLAIAVDSFRRRRRAAVRLITELGGEAE